MRRAWLATAVLASGCNLYTHSAPDTAYQDHAQACVDHVQARVDRVEVLVDDITAGSWHHNRYVYTHLGDTHRLTPRQFTLMKKRMKLRLAQLSLDSMQCEGQ